jgi:GT2 family glycosyltransferase
MHKPENRSGARTANAALPAAGAGMSLAVLIPTLNRPRELAIAVGTLLEQTLLPQELIIVDQSRSDESEKSIRKLFATERAAQIRLKYILDPGISSLAKARNVALDRNECEIFLFLDDDVELEPDFIETLLEGYAADQDVTGISGIITNYRPRGFGSRAWEWTFVRGPFKDERQHYYQRADELRASGRIAVSRFGGGLMSFRTERTGGLRFNENLRGASEGEDVDFCLHLPRGSRLEIDPRARLVHKISATARMNEHWIASIVRANCFLYYQNWRRGLRNRIAFAWLIGGFAILAAKESAERGSAAPWKAFRAAMRYGKEVGLAKK